MPSGIHIIKAASCSQMRIWVHEGPFCVSIRLHMLEEVRLWSFSWPFSIGSLFGSFTLFLSKIMCTLNACIPIRLFICLYWCAAFFLYNIRNLSNIFLFGLRHLEYLTWSSIKPDLFLSCIHFVTFEYVLWTLDIFMSKRERRILLLRIVHCDIYDLCDWSEISLWWLSFLLVAYVIADETGFFFHWGIGEKIGFCFAPRLPYVWLVGPSHQQSMLFLWIIMRIQWFFGAIIVDFEVGECPAFDISLIFVKRLIDFIPSFSEQIIEFAGLADSGFVLLLLAAYLFDIVVKLAIDWLVSGSSAVHLLIAKVLGRVWAWLRRGGSWFTAWVTRLSSI